MLGWRIVVGLTKGSVGSCSCMWERAKSPNGSSPVFKIRITHRALRGALLPLDPAKDYYHWRLTN